jgi:hypothetical protein
MLLLPDRAYLADHEGGYRSRWRHAAQLVGGLAALRRRGAAPSEPKAADLATATSRG